MSQKIKSLFLAGIPAIVIATLLVVAIIYAWTEPGSAPPEGNVPAPINVSTTTQYKAGALGIGGVFRAYSNAIFDGNVGIGTTTPATKLDVAGRIRMTEFQLGTSAISGRVLTTNTSGVGTWQPPPTILDADTVDGKHASSFRPRLRFYLTSATKLSNHNCDDSPGTCCEAGYEMCRVVWLRASSNRSDILETSGTGRDANPFGKNGWVEGLDNQCSDWESSLGTLFGAQIRAENDGEGNIGRWDDTWYNCGQWFPVWCCKWEY